MRTEDFMKLGQAAIAIADALDVLSNAVRCGGESLLSITETVAEIAPKKRVKKAEPAKALPEPEEPTKELTLTDVRAALAEKSRLGYTEEVKALITKYGAEKLSDVDPKDYAALLAEAEVIGNA